MDRFYIYVGMAFVTAFVGISWAVRGFPIPFPTARVGELSTTVDRAFGDDTSIRQHQAAVVEQSQSADNLKRNELRLATLQAANAYALAPCGPNFKAELIKTLTAYSQAYMDIRGCTFIMCSDKKVDAAAAAFDSPLDQRVQAALKDAFDRGGISVEEFPASLRMAATNFAKGRGGGASICTASN